MKTRLKALYSFVLASTLVMPSAFAAELGLQLYSLRHQLAEDMPAAVALLKDWNITVAAGTAPEGHSREAFRDELERNGVSLVEVGTSFEELRDDPMAAVERAKFFGADYATFAWIPHDGETGFGFEDARAGAEVMNTAGRVLRDHGITLQYHPHGYELKPHRDGTLLDWMLDEVTEAQFQMDVFWITHGGADPVTMLRRYPGRFTSLHLKDRAPGTPGNTDGRADVESNVVLGQGDVDIAGVVAEAERQGIRYLFIEDESSRVVTQVPKSLTYLESLGLTEGD